MLLKEESEFNSVREPEKDAPKRSFHPNRTYKICPIVFIPAPVGTGTTHKTLLRVRLPSLPNTKNAFPVLCSIELTRRSSLEVPIVDYEKLLSFDK